LRAKLRRVITASRHSWGFELELECGHDRFYFTHDQEPPRSAGCYDCAYPKPAAGSTDPDAPPSSETRDATGGPRKNSDEDPAAHKGTE
jgi:hypothetical protein